MKHTSFANMPCSVARALEAVGDGWSFLVIRDLFYGAGRFEDLLEHTGIARNILASRLRKLVESGVVEKHTSSDGGKRKKYRLSKKGRDFFPVLIALMQWGDRWESGDRGPTLRMVDRAHGQDIAAIEVADAQGHALGPEDVTIQPGPGATRAVRKRFDQVFSEGISQYHSKEITA